MELLFDVGNSYTIVGIHNVDKFFTWRLGPSILESEDILFANLSKLVEYSKLDINNIKEIGISSVVPKVNFILEQFSNKYFNIEPIFVSSEHKVYNIGYLVDYPKEIGADRLSNVIASKVDYGDNVIAVDFGTAITVDVLEGGNFVGGAIIPGFRTAINALFSKTAKLPEVDLIPVNYNLGKNTIDNIQIGVVKTTLFGIEKLIQEIKNERKQDFFVVVTGGDAKFLKFSFFDKYDSNLTLKGIKYYMKEVKTL
ncbi:type III pantothenate kinase [Petrotoga sp. 9PWA.NaAc.5.4]|uniref:type III pantothenate kinase n=1 Tax=Petrotoga sp. 9PWA.NaAc.5.4 TaxID=1434328 RepID=UPI000CC1CFE9|nr:type III pantothenate kinase [Petrotoga sp. 9PWA.NaAc.5.4]PNR92810.1 pantothenate kinase [Petrotoga sp. 9PWA.NaAc.5.4]